MFLKAFLRAEETRSPWFDGPDLLVFSSLRANGSRECAPDDRLREAIHLAA
jgi:hypothetical protein